MTKISALPAGTTATGAESIPAVQGLNTVKLTLAKVATTASASDITTGTLPAAQLPTPTVSTLGGVESIAASPHNWINSISTSGVPALSQPAFTDVSGSVAATQMPALTGDITTSAGAVATTLATVNANVGSFGSATQASQVTVNAKGLVTAAAGVTVTPAVGSITGLGTGVPAALGNTLNAASGLVGFSGNIGAATATSLTAAGAVLSSSATGGVGYSTGAGGTVTQITSKSTGVALNALSGGITMNNAALAAGTIVSFVVTDTSVANTDAIIVNHLGGGTPGAYTVNARASAGSFTIDIRNNTAGSLSEAIQITFAVIKGANG